MRIVVEVESMSEEAADAMGSALQQVAQCVEKGALQGGLALSLPIVNKMSDVGNLYQASYGYSAKWSLANEVPDVN